MNVKLTVSVAMQQKSLLISCTITNNETRRIGVFSRIQRVNLDGSRNLDIANCYIDLEGEKLVLQKVLLAIPPELHVTAKPVPFARIVEGGRSLVESWELPVPIMACNPYRRAILAAENPGLEVVAGKSGFAKGLRMTYGGFMIDDEDCVRPLGNAFPEILVVKRPGQIEADQVLLNCDVELKMEVPVLDYVALK